MADSSYIDGIRDPIARKMPSESSPTAANMRDNVPISPSGHWAKPLTEAFAAHGNREVIFAFCGPLDRPQLEQLLARAEECSLAANDPTPLRKRLYNVLVEGLENVHRHTPPDLSESGFALLVREENVYRITLGNALPLAAATLLTHRVDILNDMDDADLREHYLKLLANEGRTERGGAGLGLLTMARKTARPIVARTLPRDQASAYVTVELSLA